MRFLDTFVDIYKRPIYIVMNIIFVIAYYYLFFFIVKFQNSFLFITIPIWLVYSLILSSSILITISIYSLLNSGFSFSNGSMGLASALTTFISSVVVGCGCTAPIIFSLAALGLSSLQLVALNSFFASNQLLIVVSMLIINLLFIIYYAGYAKRASACKVSTNEAGS
ncbi:MAG: hypothetical protein ACP5UN_01890 [Candidatus Micrarchaeia archaeon]